MSSDIAELAIVVPARDEAGLLPAALAALEVAKTHFAQKNPTVPVSLTVVLDCTTDTSAELLAAYPGVCTLNVVAGQVGTARNAGIAEAWSRAGSPANRLWIANTDADSEVPADWLIRQHELASDGAQVVVGTVEPRSVDVRRHVLRRWFASQQLRDDHPHIHGANLGFRADVFAVLGGFGDQGLHEDRDFVVQARARGYAVVATDTCRVKTSGRLKGRANGGFADFLSRLEAGPVLAPRLAAAVPAFTGSMEAGAAQAAADLQSPEQLQGGQP